MANFNFRAILGTVLLSGAVAFGAGAAEQPSRVNAGVAPDLLRAAPAKTAASAEALARKVVADKGALRARATSIDFPVMAEVRGKLQVPGLIPSIRVPFFDDAAVTIEVTRTEPTSSGGVAYVGRVPGDPHSIAVMVDNASVVAMIVNTSAKRYAIHGTSESGYVSKELSMVDRPDHPPGLPYVTGPNAVPAATGGKEIARMAADPTPGPIIQADDGSTMDVMVIYTPAARLAQTPGTTAQMNANIDAQVALTNTIYANSNVVQRLRLVYKGEVNYTEVNMDVDLNRLLNFSDGFLDDVPALRNLYGADFVSFWGLYNDYCGLGSLMVNESSASNANRAFNTVASPSCTTGGYTFAHELGHNMGLRHDNYMDTGTNVVTPEGSAVLTTIGYAHGYIDLINRFRTVMSYNDQCVATPPNTNCTRIPHFSNPSIFYNAATTGNAANAHERQALNDVRETTANFRTAIVTTGPGIVLFVPDNTLSVAEAAGTATLRVERHVGSTGAISVSYATAAGTATPGLDYTTTTGTLSWADGETAAKFIPVAITQDAVIDANETFTVTLSNPTGGASIGAQGGISSSATVTIIDDDDPGVIVFAPTSYSIGEGGGTVQLRVSRTVGTNGAISVAYATANGTATAGSDFTAVSGTLSWALGETADKTIDVPILQDTALEGAQAFTVVLSAPTGGASIGTQGGATTSATVTIIDDDPDNFPAGGVVPLEYTNLGSPAGLWELEPVDGYLSPTSLRSARVVSAANDFTNYVNSDLSYSGNFQAGNVTFAYKISSYHQGYQQFDFLIDGLVQLNHPGGESGWLTASVPVAAGAHTLTWRFKSRLPFLCSSANPAPPGGANCANRAYVDGIVLPLTGSTLTVVRNGNGTGTVSATGIFCGTDCTEVYATNTVVTLTAAPGVGSLFAGWSGGGCSGTGACTTTMSAAQTVTATFNLLPEPFPVNCVMPAGFVTPAGTTTGWSVGMDRAQTGNCSLKSNTMSDASPGTYNKAQIQTSGNFAEGNISFYYSVSSETNYDCLRFLVDGVPQAIGGTCTFSGGIAGASGNISPPVWTQVTIPVSAGARVFTWSYEKDDSVSVGSDAAWIDNLVLPALAPVTLSVVKAGSGAGTVSGGSINCGATCSSDVTPGTVVVLTAVASGGSSFTGWSGGGCTGTGTCSVTVNAATTVTATFTLQQFNLTVARAGTGTGTVTSSPGGITCGAACVAPFNFGTVVTLSASAGGGSMFAGWSGGGCTGTGTCVVTISAASTVTATFDLNNIVPGAPTIGIASPGDGQALVNFTAPAPNGGTSITQYNVTCTGGGGGAAFGPSSPITVTGLTNGVLYTCSVTATNSAGTGPASGTVTVTPSGAAPLVLTAVQSRKLHGALGPFFVPIALDVPLAGNVSVEPRSGASHTIVFMFNGTVNAPGTASITPVGSATAFMSGGNEVSVTVTGVPDASRATVTLTGVTGAAGPANASVTLGFLVGDVNGSRSVNAADIAAVKANQGAAVSQANARFDINATGGTIGAPDVSAVKARSPVVLP